MHAPVKIVLHNQRYETLITSANVFFYLYDLYMQGSSVETQIGQIVSTMDRQEKNLVK